MIIRTHQAWTESESSIQGLYRLRVNAPEYPIVGSQTAPVLRMAHFKSEPTILSPRPVRPHTPGKSEHEMRHNLVFNTEAYANRYATYHRSWIPRQVAVNRSTEHMKRKNEQKLRSKTCIYCQIPSTYVSIFNRSPMDSTYGSQSDSFGPIVDDPPRGSPIGRMERLMDPLPTCTTKMKNLGLALVGCTASPRTRNICAVDVI